VHAELLEEVQLLHVHVQREQVQPLASGQLEEELQVQDIDPELMQSSNSFTMAGSRQSYLLTIARLRPSMLHSKNIPVANMPCKSWNT